MRILVFIALATLTMVACVAPKPKEKGVATTKPTNEQAHKAPPTMKDSTPAQHLAVPDTATKYTEEDGGISFSIALNPPKVHDKNKKRKCLIETVVNTIPPSNILISQMLYPNEGKFCNDPLPLQK